MNALVRKEVRLLLPVWIGAVLQAVLPTLLIWSITHQRPPEALIYAPFGLGVLLLGLTSFGYEFGTGTFSIFLAQPIPRIRLWRMKTRLLAVALASVWFAFFISAMWMNAISPEPGGLFIFVYPELVEPMTILALMSVVAFSSVLWTTLLFRQVAAAFWFSILIPSFLAVFTQSALNKHSSNVVFACVSILLLVYSVAGFFFARRMFLRAQDAAWTGGNISLPAWLGFKTAQSTPAIPKLKPLRALLRKEFQSHQITLGIAALLLVSHLIGIAVRKLEYDPTNPHKTAFEVFGFWWLLWFALPMIIGATVVAEERKLGTLEGQLCLPVKRGWQFTVKFVMALLLGIFLGGVMPGLCEGIAMWAGVPGEFPAVKAPEFWPWLTVCCLIATGIVLVSIYASTLTRNLLQALGTTVLAGILLSGFGTLVIQQEHIQTPLWTGSLGIYVGVPILLAVLLWLGFKNFKSLQVGLNLWCRNSLTILAAMILIVVATTLIWNRIWELAMTLEPPHGPARLSGQVRPGICLAWSGKTFALLPDGRVWMADKYRKEDTGELRSYFDQRTGKDVVEKVQIAVPVNGAFLATSNWAQLADSFEGVVGIAADGSLWRFNTLGSDATDSLAYLSRVPQLERVGEDSDWKMVVGLGGDFALLKQDGSIWTWARYQAPVKFGHDSDWTAIFAGQYGFVGLKGDGSVWGNVQNDTSPNLSNGDRVRWAKIYPAGSDWAIIDHNRNFDLLIKNDGTLWACGHLPENILGKKVNTHGPNSRFAPQPIQIGSSADFADIRSEWGSCLVLNKAGAIYADDFSDWHLALWGSGRKLSQNSGWIAIASAKWNRPDIALAADGTLSAWEDPRDRGYSGQWLGPTRKPLWTLNILDESK